MKFAATSGMIAALLTLIGCAQAPRETVENSPLLADPNAKKMNFISITYFDPEQVPYMIKEAHREAESSGITRNAYKFSIYPYAPPEDVVKRAEAFGKLRAGLAGSEVEPGILIVCTIGQGWTIGLLPYQPMEFTVNQKGELNYRICMRDPNFRKYIHDAIVAFAKQKPSFFLIDDDFRSINNSSYGVECFCASHMKIYNERMPRKFANDRELVAYLEKAPADDPCVKIFEQERRKTLLDYAKLIRGAIDEVDPSIPCGYCSGGGEYLLAGDIAKALAGKNESFLRIHDANYLELDPQQFNIVMYFCAFRARAAKDKVDYILDEADTYTRNRYAKSAISMHSHITGSILYGTSGAKLWITNLVNPEMRESNLAYEKIIKKNRRFYDALLAEMPHTTWLGPVTPLIDASKNFNPARAMQSFAWLQDYQICNLNRFGIPARYEYVDGNGVYMLNGTLAKCLSDEELKTILSGKALVDGHAALEIARRGFASYLGCTPKLELYSPGGEIKCTEPKYTLVVHNDGTLPNLTQVSPQAQIITRFAGGAGTKGKLPDPGPGTILYRNPAGGTVVTRASAVGIARVNDEYPEVKHLLLEIFAQLDPELIPFYIGEEQPVHFRCGKHDRGGYLLALVNLSYDPLTEIDLRTAQKVNSVEFLDGDGIYKPLKFTTSERGIVIDRQVACYEPLILRVK